MLIAVLTVISPTHPVFLAAFFGPIAYILIGETAMSALPALVSHPALHAILLQGEALHRRSPRWDLRRHLFTCFSY